MNIIRKVISVSINCKVKFGSNLLTVNVGKQTTCRELLVDCLKKSKIVIKNSPKGYRLIERNKGVERFVHYNEIIFDIVKNFQAQNSEFQFIIKKSKKSNAIAKSMSRYRKYGNKIFQMLNQSNQSITNVYEDVPSEGSTPMNVTRTILSSKRHPSTAPIVYNLKSIRNLKEKLKTRLMVFDQEFYI